MEQGTDVKIYGRTQQVQDVIVAGLSDANDCVLVTDAHLAAITTLNLSGQGMTALRADDFAGLRGGPRNWDSLLRWDPDQGEGVWNATEETELSC